MRDLDDFVRKTVIELEPVVGVVGIDKASTTTTITNKSTLFEDGQPPQIKSEWQFTTPVMTHPTTIDLQRLLRNYNLSSLAKPGGDTRELLLTLGIDINRYRDKCCNVKVEHLKEVDLVYCLNFTDILSRYFENNHDFFVYSNGTSNDKFRFEHLHILLMLLGYYNTQALAINVDNELDPLKRKELSRSKARLFTLCIEVLKELNTKCIANTTVDGGDKIVYQQAPRSLSMDPVKGVIITDDNDHRVAEPPSIKAFIETCLGGEQSVLARIQLCAAKRHESIYDMVACDQSLNRDADGRLRANLIGRIALIEKAYLEAANHAKKNEQQNEGLYQHARFMAHYWLCRAHYILAKHDSIGLLSLLQSNIESAEECGKAQEVIGRLMLITNQAIEMKTLESVIMSKLSPNLGNLYKAMIDDVQIVTEAFDREIYDKRNLHEKAVTLKLQLIPERSNEVNLFSEARKQLFLPYYEQNPSFTECRQLLNALGERLKQPTHAKELLISKNNNNNTNRAPRVTVTTTAAIIEPMEKIVKLGLLGERQKWLQFFIDSYSQIDHEFVFTQDLYEKIKNEVAVTERAIKQVENQ